MKEDKAEDRIIIVEDDRDLLMLLTEFLRDNGYSVEPYQDGIDALSVLKNNDYSLLITDLIMPGITGLQLIKYIQKEYLDTIGIVITGNGSLESAINAMKLGAFDYIVKPFNLEEMLSIVSSALYYHKLLKNGTIPREMSTKATLLRRFSKNKIIKEGISEESCLKKEYNFTNIVGISFCMQKVFETIEKVADTDATVLITGESGVGKELISKTIHYNSSRNDKPLVIVNCGAIPETLLESELFGYEKGAFTGANTTRYGRFEMADGGTVFLDEIGDMSLNLQVKLLRVLQEKTFERVGSSKTIKVDVRIIAATNKDLEQLINEGRFREDLYYRLNVVPIHIPALRERRQDIPLLLNHFLEMSNRANKADIEGFTKEAMEILTNYNYPGNVRELQNIIERIVILKRTGVIDIEDLPEKVLTVKAKRAQIDIQKGYDTLVTEFEKDVIIKALNESGGIKTKAAKILNINRTTLIEKMKRFGIE